MGRQKNQVSISGDVYQKLVDAFRANPGRTYQVSIAVGVPERLARKAWHTGWKRGRTGTWARAIRIVLEEERERIRLERTERIAKVSARVLEIENGDAARQRAEKASAEQEEGRALTAARRDVLGVALVLGRLLPSMDGLAKRVEQSLAEAGSLKPRELLGLLSTYALAASRVSAAVEQVTRVGRLVRGETTAEVGFSAMTDEMVVEELEAAHALVEQMRAERGGEGGERVVVDGTGEALDS